ncbi:MAG: hypothetical protein JSS09_05895, partial [Verrucomicrobia bacterium]|nr:hypothetical protein [Verrucomicrobiota bacterium]
RSMLRLLWDSQHEKPVLFLDRLYPNPCPPKRAEAILFAAKECAKQLDLELFQQSDVSSSGREIVSLGSSCPYEYADAAEGVMKDGKFSVKASAKIGY